MTDADVDVTWVGHATVLIEVNGRRILTDPLVTKRVGHLVRHVAMPDAAPADVVLISHVHMDHLHGPSLARVAQGAHVVAPAGASPLLSKAPLEALDEVRAGDAVSPARVQSAEPIEIEVVHAEHRAGRGPHSRRRAAPVGYLVRVAGVTIYFAGDTALFDDMASIGPVDVALLPIWGWGKTLGELHLDPATAVDATRLCGAERVVPIHWGTYSPMRVKRGPPEWLDSPVAAFREQLDQHHLGDRLVALQPGESVRVARR
jgi:L-ascorbate metabolism protein UlaG (beta-lactamase superfamily)